MRDGASRTLALLKAIIARSDLGKFFPAQTQPVVPSLPHAVAWGEIAPVELVAFDNLRESGIHRQLLPVVDGIGGPDRGGVMRVACCGHGKAGQSGRTTRKTGGAAQRGRRVEALQRTYRQPF